MQKNLHSLYSAWQIARQQKQHRLAQGRLTANEATTHLADDGEMPLARLPVSHGKTPTVYATAENRGHLLIVAPPGSSWREQLCLTVSYWPGAALIVDPDGQLYQQTAALRQTIRGPVYAHPGYQLRGDSLLRFWQEAPAFRLHQLLLPANPFTGSTSEAEIQAATNRTISLICAIGRYSQVHKRHPFQLLLDVALTDMLRALAALETVPQARLHVRHFTKGQPPHLAIYDAATVQAFSWFCHQLWPYQAGYDAFALAADKAGIVPERWFRHKQTLYLTYPANQMAEMAGLVATLVRSQLLEHETFGGGQPLLLVLDAYLAGRLPHFSQFLATAADYGITVVLTAPSLASLAPVSPASSAETVISQFAHQLWYAPRERETAVYMATRYGTQLNPEGGQESVLTREEVLGWSDEELLLLTRQERPYLVLGQPVTLPEDFPQRQPPRPPTAGDLPRAYDSWLPPLSGLTEQVQAALIAQGAMPAPAQAKAKAKAIVSAEAVVQKKEEGGETAVSPAPAGAEESLPNSNPDDSADNLPKQPEPPMEDDEASEKSLNIVRTKFR
ncbi:MAG: type IV secretory system conjugative DNA transfer family protein [Ardenticatenaceae bacterium]|nr:type IV secretory system conjugative DNA transfer family protein [Ardenticatenaceae bacterium]